MATTRMVNVNAIPDGRAKNAASDMTNVRSLIAQVEAAAQRDVVNASKASLETFVKKWIVLTPLVQGMVSAWMEAASARKAGKAKIVGHVTKRPVSACLIAQVMACLTSKASSVSAMKAG